MTTVFSPQLDALRELFQTHDRVLHVTHLNPDPDGIGSALAMHRWLCSQGKASRIALPSPAPKHLGFLSEEGELEVPDATALAEWLPGALVMVYDVSSLGRLGGLASLLAECTNKMVLFDHHDGDADFDCLAFVDPDAGATAQVIHEIFDGLGVAPSLELALPLYCGLIADTGSFNYGKTSPRTHEIAAAMLAAGVDPLAVHGELEGSNEIGALQLHGRALSSLRFDDLDRRIAYLVLDAQTLGQDGRQHLDAIPLVNSTIALRGVEAGLLLLEQEDGSTRISFRSKGSTSIVETARSFGGGGHRNAAGAGHEAAPAAALPQVLERLRADLAQQLGPA
jgi:phosphoesterase RecJ-like protein